jgi:hypothetical protein
MHSKQGMHDVIIIIIRGLHLDGHTRGAGRQSIRTKPATNAIEPQNQANCMHQKLPARL